MNELSARERVKYWEELRANPMYKLWREVMDAQVKTRESVILDSKITPETLPDYENIRGERAGILLAFSVADTMFETAQVELESDNTQSKENGNESV